MSPFWDDNITGQRSESRSASSPCGGRPLTKGTGAPLVDQSSPLLFPRNFNRVSAPDANSCAGCHNMPFSGGGADIAGSVFVLAQRFDFATFDHADGQPTRGAVDELGRPVTLEVHVSEGDMGRVIGKRGRVANAIRTVVRAAAARDGVDVDIEFVD